MSDFLIMMVNQVRRLQQSPAFIAWHEQHPSTYLAHIFYLTDTEPQVGYYNKEKDTITPFIMGSTIIQQPEQEVFKKDHSIELLEIAEVKISLMQVIEKARAFQEEKYPKEQVVREIIILQHLHLGQVYNVTFVTSSMKALNMKLSAVSGDIMEHHVSSLMDFTQR